MIIFKMDKFKLINEKLRVGVWLDEMDLIKLIKITFNRNTTYCKKLIRMYEDLTEKKFDMELIKK